MPRLPTDYDRYGSEPALPLTAAVHGAVRDLVRSRWHASGLDWGPFVLAADDLITGEDLAGIDAAVLATGHRYTASAVISARERPEAYRGGAATTGGFAHPEAPHEPADDRGRAVRGIGDNVVRGPHNVVGKAVYVRSSEDVVTLMQAGVPAHSIAVIDDSGGTLTAPILERFAGVVCAGGTVRSHLGILTREYGIPCLMNVRLAGVVDGDTIELETSAVARTAESYQAGRAMPSRIWKHVR